jgi:hypothetical protein
LGLSSCSALAASRISHPGPVGGRRSATPHRRRHSRALADTESSQASLRVASRGRGRSVSILLTEASQKIQAGNFTSLVLGQILILLVFVYLGSGPAKSEAQGDRPACPHPGPVLCMMCILPPSMKTCNSSI